ncbi:mycofactocin biosynthesis glycosyltransferase MftF [Microbispora triticiradicis]|uniref:mycofactocin biosynthesis glycosyltransferase MftF n=1 Tax=Microbispora triticiradicis TaxID=2200763 RepID=UPI001AD7179D|nr:mycofactocin biosynthesis glycosyltransferase MftF [Microbispora triticiradicis]MBO4271228.1 mycofactocin system glycosyltransferase [Microbispora triticiradicis]
MTLTNRTPRDRTAGEQSAGGQVHADPALSESRPSSRRQGGGGEHSCRPGRLPDGFTVRLNRRVRVRDGGRTLVGGAPTRVMYLTPAAADLFDGRGLRVRDRVSALLADRLLEAGLADPVVGDLPGLDPSQVTVVVPVRDRPAALDRLLSGIGDRHRVIVVDDASAAPDAVAEVAAAHGAVLVALTENVGPAAARNAGLRRVTTPYVAFADSDVVLEPGTLPTLLRHFADPRVAVAAPRVLGLRLPGRDRWILRYEDARSSLDLGLDPGIVRPRAPVSWVPSAFLLARVDALGHGFSADMRVGEDVDLVWRLARAGWRVRYEPAATVRHEHRTVVHDWLRRKAFYGTGADLLARRHGRDVAPAVLAPWSAAFVLALLAQRRWSLPAAALIFAGTAATMSAKVRRSEHPVRLALTLTSDGAVAAVWQATALLLRHWWPLAAVGCLLSRRLRRAVAAVAVMDALTDLRRTGAHLDPVRYAVARRLDDAAYGSGLWLGALRGRSVRALLPDIRWKTRSSRPSA